MYLTLEEQMSNQADAFMYPSELKQEDAQHFVHFMIFSESTASLSGSKRPVRNESGGFDANTENSKNAEADSASEGDFGSGAAVVDTGGALITSQTRMSDAKKKNDDAIILPMPQNLTVSDGWNWEMLSFQKGAIGEAVSGLVSGGGDLEGAGAVMGSKIAGGLANVLMENGERLFEAANRVAFNPRKEMLFNEPNQRNFTFEYDFAPRNQQDSEALRDILSLFKIHAAPERIENGALFKYPSEFQIVFHTGDGENGFISRIARTALKSLQTSYTNAGVFSALNGNGSPSHIKVTLEFGELELLDRSHYKKGY